MECTMSANSAACTCTYEPCPRKGRCCACIAYHKRSGELPGCLFPPEIERTFDRSAEAFARSVKHL